MHTLSLGMLNDHYLSLGLLNREFVALIYEHTSHYVGTYV